MRCRCFHHHTFGVIHPHAGRHSALSIVIATTFARFHRRLAAVQNRIQIVDGRRNAAIRRDRNLRAGEVNLSLIQLVTQFKMYGVDVGDLYNFWKNPSSWASHVKFVLLLRWNRSSAAEVVEQPTRSRSPPWLIQSQPSLAALCPPLIMKLYQSCSKNKAPCVSVVFCFCYQRRHSRVDQQKLSRYRAERLKKVR